MTENERKEVEELTKALQESISKENSTWNSFEVVAKRLVAKGYTKRPQDNNALVPLDEEEVKKELDKLSQSAFAICYHQDRIKMAKIICSKFGKDNNALVPLGNKMLVAKELYEICCYPDPTKWDDITQDEKDVWQTRASIFADTIGKDNSGMVIDKNSLADMLKDSAQYALGVHRISFFTPDIWPVGVRDFYLELYDQMMRKFPQQPPKERKVSLEEFAKKLAHKDIPSKTWDDWSLNQQNWYIKEASEILSLLNATEERKGE